MKRIFSLLLVLAMMLSLVACGGSTTMTMGTGSPTGTYYAYGGIIGQYITNNAGINVNAVSTGGSKDNIQGIDVGDYQLGTVQSDVMHYTWNGTRSFEEDGKVETFRTVAGLYAEAVQLVTVNPDIKSVADLKDKKPNELSGGQCQRVAIARALVNQPEIIFADEPTGALDSENAELFMQLLKRVNLTGTSIVLVTHDNNVARFCNQIFEISDGTIK